MTTDTHALESVARTFGRLLLQEIDAPLRDELIAPVMAEALASVGIDVAPLRAPDALDELAVEFLESFVQPKDGAPLVQSLWTGGSYEGDAAVMVRRLAQAGQFAFDRHAARGAANDHLGSILMLWAATRTAIPDIADRLEQDHLAWALAPLSRIAIGEGFYADVARATQRFLETLTGPQRKVRSR